MFSTVPTPSSTVRATPRPALSALSVSTFSMPPPGTTTTAMTTTTTNGGPGGIGRPSAAAPVPGAGYAPRRDDETEGLSMAMQRHREIREMWETALLRIQEYMMQARAAETIDDMRTSEFANPTKPVADEEGDDGDGEMAE